MTEQLYYFGTNMIEKGHYLWKVTPDGLRERSIDFSALPFNPEQYPRQPKSESLNKGTIIYYFEHGFTILAIEGSCIDQRPGSKTVFFIKGLILESVFIAYLNTFQIYKYIIEALYKQYPQAHNLQTIIQHEQKTGF
jgi:hypothetical protein